MKTIRDHVINQHIQENYPNAAIVSWEENDSGLKFYTANQLQDVDADWFPLCSYLDDSTGKVVYGGRDKIVHTYTEGETGSGKTTRFVMQNIRALSSLKNKPSFFIVDIHGEIVENLYDHLKENGYEVKVLNCDDPSHSDTYNPFLPIARRCLKADKLDHDALNQIRKIAELMQPVQSHNDPIWEIGARSYTNGLILSMFEDLLAMRLHEADINFYSLIENHYWLRNKLNSSSAFGDLFKIPHFQKRPRNSQSIQKLLSVTNNAEKTRASYFGVVENHMDAFGHPSLYQLSSTNTIEIEDFIEKPTALFIQAGNTKIGDCLISLLMNEIYSTAVEIGKARADKHLPRNVHCFLDEFANCNIAEGPEFIKMLTTSRKFGLYWHLLLQCDVQLDSKYGPNIGKIIRANCTEIYMGSHDYETTVRFAQSCGKKTVESLASRITGQTPLLETVDLMTPDRLSLIEEGCVYIKTNRHPLLQSYYEAFYHCPEFKAVTDLEAVYPINTADYELCYSHPDNKLPDLCDEELDIMLYLLHHGRTRISELVEKFGEDCLYYLSTGLELAINTYDHHLPYLERSIDNATMSAGQILLLERKREQLRQYRAEAKARAALLGEDYDDDDEYDDDEYDDGDEYEDEADCESDEDVFDDLFTDGSIEDTLQSRKALPPHSGMVKEIEQQLEQLEDPIDLSVLDGLTSVPSCIKDLYNAFAFPDILDPVDPYEFDMLRPNLLHFEILEHFIQQNNFRTKEAWVDLFTREMEIIKEIPFFSATLIDCFARAGKELDEELTFENIQEIKKILQDTEDDEEDE